MADILDDLRKFTRLRGNTYSSAEVVGMIGKSVQEIERLRAALESLTKDPPATLSREPDEDWEVIVKMRKIARDALDAAKGMETET